MPKAAPPLEIPPRDKRQLRNWTQSRNIPAGLAQRARIVLLAGHGLANAEIAERTGVSRPTVILWRNRYASGGPGALEDKPRSGRPRRIDPLEIVVRTLEPPPARLGVTHWSSRLLAKELGISNATVATAWQDYDLQPWRSQTFKFSADPQLEAKVRDIVGLYLNPPENAVVVCIDEKTQIQALNRTAPILPIRPGLPEKATCDYVRNGTTTLFAALEVATGKVTDTCYPRHRNTEFLKIPQAGREAIPPPRPARHLRQLRHPQAPQRQGLAGEEPSDHPAFHPDVRVVAEHGGDLLRHHHPAGHPPRLLRLSPRADRRDPPVHRWLERPLRAVHLDQARRRDPRQSHP